MPTHLPLTDTDSATLTEEVLGLIERLAKNDLPDAELDRCNQLALELDRRGVEYPMPAPHPMPAPSSFGDLLARRDDLADQHSGWCEGINDGSEDTAYTRSRRDQCYAEFVRVQEQIESELAAETAAETAAELAEKGTQ